MRRFWWFPRLLHPVCVACALLSVASAPRSARAQSSTAPEGPVLATVRHTLIGEVGEVMQATWRPFTPEPGSGRWVAAGRVHSNVPVVAVIRAAGETPVTGWLVRTPTGALAPWDGRDLVVSAPLGPGASDVVVQLVAVDGAQDDRPAVLFRLAPATRP